jgi:hypothetical protein
MIIPWSDMLAAAVRIGIAPEQFWKTSLKEWRLIAQANGPEAMALAEFAALAGQYPDGGTSGAG